MRGLTRTRWVAGAVGLTLATVGLAACSSDDSSNAAGGSLSVSLAQPQTLLPTNIQDVESVQPRQRALHRSGRATTRRVSRSTQMADSITSDDNTVWTIKLKDGWTFHDGTKVTASSYVDAWNFGAYSPNAQVNSSYFSAIDGYDERHGLRPRRRRAEEAPRRSPRRCRA